MSVNVEANRDSDKFLFSQLPYKQGASAKSSLRAYEILQRADFKFDAKKSFDLFVSPRAPEQEVQKLSPVTFPTQVVNFAKNLYASIKPPEKFPDYPSIEFGRYSTGGIFLDRMITSPLIALGFRVQTEEKSFVQVFKDIKASNTPIKSLYAGMRPLMIRDLLFLPVFVPIVDNLRQMYFPKKNLQPSSEFGKAAAAAAYYGVLTSLLSCIWQYFNPLPGKTSIRKVLTTTVQEHGFRFYRGFKNPSHRMAMIGCLYNGFIAGLQQLLSNLRTSKKNNP